MFSFPSASPHLHFGSYLPGWVTNTRCWRENKCRSLFGQVFVLVAQLRKHVHACQCSLCICGALEFIYDF